MAHHYETVVVGGGFSGLTAALRLLQHNKSVLVLEADPNTVGGRTRSTALESTTDEADGLVNVSYGGTFTMYNDFLTMGLAKEVDNLKNAFIPGLPTIECTIKSVVKMAYSPRLLNVLWKQGCEIFNANPSDYWNHPKAKELDSIDLESWLQQHKSWLEKNDKFELFYHATEAVRNWFLIMENMPMVLSEISVLWASIMVYVRSSLPAETVGSPSKYECMSPLWFVPRAIRWCGGTGHFVSSLVAGIHDLGGKILTGKRVTKLIHNESKSQVFVYGSDGSLFATADHVIVALSVPASIKQEYISYEPALPLSMQQMSIGQQEHHDPAINIIYLFKKTPGWYTGLSVAPDPATAPPLDSGKLWGCFLELSDRSIMPTGADSTKYGVLRLLVDKARVKGMTEEQMIQKGLEWMIECTGNSWIGKKMSNILKEKEYFIKADIIDWTKIETIPAVTYFWKPGHLTRQVEEEDGTKRLVGDYLRYRHERILFAGSERSIRGMNWIEGAVRRGTEVAAEILEETRAIPSAQDYIYSKEREGDCISKLYRGRDCIEYLEDKVKVVKNVVEDFMFKHLEIMMAFLMLILYVVCVLSVGGTGDNLKVFKQEKYSSVKVWSESSTSSWINPFLQSGVY